MAYDSKLAKYSTEAKYTLDEIGRCRSSNKTSGMSKARGEAKAAFARANRRHGRALAREAKFGE